MRQMNPTWSPKVRMKDGLRLHLNPSVPECRLPVSCVMQDQCGRTERSKAHCICSQFFHSSANTDTPTQVSARWRRLRSSGAVNLAAVETHTRMTVTMASIMLMHFPSSTLASAFSSWTVCCCCCCCSSSLDTRVWHDSSISCSKKEFINILLLHNLIQIWEKKCWNHTVTKRGVYVMCTHTLGYISHEPFQQSTRQKWTKNARSSGTDWESACKSIKAAGSSIYCCSRVLSEFILSSVR